MVAFTDCYRDRDIVVTGHTGFKGSWLSMWLTSLGARVHGYSKDIPTVPSLFSLVNGEEVVDHTIGDVRDLEGFRTFLLRKKPSYVFHLAAQPIVSLSYSDPIETMSTNIMGTAVVLEALRSVDWPCVAIIITSDKCYDNVEWVWGYRETDALGGKDVYSGSKGAAELVVRSYFHSFFKGHPVKLAVGRAGNVIGGGDWAADRIVADCVRAWLDNDKVPIRSPAATRPWQHVLEPLSGYLALAAAMTETSELNGEAFNFGPRAEQSRTVTELLTDLAGIWGHSDAKDAFTITGQVPFHEASLLKLNCDKALLQLKWRPNLSYEECVAFTGEWYRDVLKEKKNARDLTMRQIDRYVELAAGQKIAWTGAV